MSDVLEAEKFIRFINYDRFSGFCLRFQVFDSNANDHRFIPGTRFEDIVELCRFDALLRDCISDALETVEISLRTSVAFHFGKSFGAFGHLDRNNFDKSFSRQVPSKASTTKYVVPYEEWKNAILVETQRSQELFVRHFKETYTQFPNLPIWMVSEICSFGTLSHMYSHLRNTEQGAIAKDYGIHYLVLASWLHTFTYIRNVCAHHARLWDKRVSITPKLPSGKNWITIAHSGNTIYVVTLMLNWMLAHDSVPKKLHVDWKKRVESLVDKFSVRFPQLLSHTGFPSNWKKTPLWWQI
ncbi:MAG: Abi family protein [Kiritimatiellae bacterium]|nr:Abi family protein [Kiritimatiellia bacterium]